MRPVGVALLLSSLSACTAAAAQVPGFERCASCHSGTDATKELAPKLDGVFGRKAGSREDFRYSRALVRSAVTWDDSSLDAFLKAPDQFIPGTRMPFEGIASDTERAVIIKYLKTLK
jgi:cytochrome c